MKLLNNLSSRIQTLNKKDFEKYLSLFLASILISTTLISYFIYNKSSDLVSQIQKLNITVNRTANIVEQYKTLEQKEQELKQMLMQNKEFNIKIFFEQFTAQMGMVPDPDWKPITQPVEGSEKFDEVSLNATFKNQTMKNLASFLDKLDKKQTIYIKDLFIKNEGSKKINFEIIIATKKFIG